jgi:chemotaxis protein methyltransferase WspC
MNIEKIINIIHAETGIDASTIGEYSYVSAIQNCMKKCGLDDFSEYLRLLESSRSEITNLIEEIIVPETWFFRDEQAFNALLLELNRDNSYPKRILSLPSSTGEEAYSIAIKLFENGYSQDMFSIDAIDISQRNIDAARRAKYRQHSFRNKQPERIMQKYFIAHEDTYEAIDKIKNAVTFTRGNLFDFDTLAKHRYYDAIFCRNLFIYFNKSRKDTAFRKLHAALKDNGIFLIGHSEASIIPTRYYTPCSTIRSFGFIKSRKPVTKKKATPVKNIIIPIKASKPVKIDTPAVTTRPAKQDHQVIPAPVKKDATIPGDTLKQARKLADRGRFDEALKMALAVCSDNSTAECFTLLGAIYSALNSRKQAENAFRKALFLEPNYHEAIVHLALLLEKKGDQKNAELLRKRMKKSQSQIEQVEHSRE